ncbi:SDR family NAD(P)-dependent oxidoreductase [Rhizobium leguminosarum]|nr:SDR family NAD(P)-dependent oxidoreductase [Rhizobium leguminosarum]
MKRALITGASGGIGRSIARQLAQDGFDLFLAGRSTARLQAAGRGVQTACPGSKIETVALDVSDAEAVRTALAKLKDRGLSFGVLVNGAGISGGGITRGVTTELWDRVIDVNLNGAFYVTRDALSLDLIEAGGRIINIASTGGKQGVIHAAPYCASKHGVIGLTRALGLELARNGSGITVNAVCPGFVETEMAERVREHYATIWNTDVAEAKRRIEERVPIGRYISSDEVAGMVAYLASPLGAGVTAQALNVCGGLGNY